MRQLIATGKWSKDEKRWRMVVALRAAGRKANGPRAVSPMRGSFDPGEATRSPGSMRPPRDF